MSKALAVNDENFQAEVLDSKIPVLVDFWATWCPPCRMMGPVVDELAEDLAGRAKVVKMDIDQSRATAAKYGIMSVPTFHVFLEGDVVASVVGGQKKQVLLDAVEQFIK